MHTPSASNHNPQKFQYSCARKSLQEAESNASKPVSGDAAIRALPPRTKERDELTQLPRLLLINHAWSANLFRLQRHIHFHAIGNFDKGNAAVHPVFLAIERHRSLDIAGARALAGQGKLQRLLFRHPAYRKRARNVKGSRTSLLDLRRMKCNVRIIVRVEEIFALQLAVLQPASRIHAGGVNLQVQNAGRNIRRREFQRSFPLLEHARDRYRRLHVESNLEAARRWCNFENGNLRRSLCPTWKGNQQERHQTQNS